MTNSTDSTNLNFDKKDLITNELKNYFQPNEMYSYTDLLNKLCKDSKDDRDYCDKLLGNVLNEMQSESFIKLHSIIKENYKKEFMVECIDKDWVDKELKDDDSYISIGEGTHTVYLLCTLADEKEAKDNNEVPIGKVGYTENIDKRIKELSASTTNITKKRLRVGIKTNYPKELESYLHNLLKAKGLKYEEGIGDELYRISPKEFIDIYEKSDFNIRVDVTIGYIGDFIEKWNNPGLVCSLTYRVYHTIRDTSASNMLEYEKKIIDDFMAKE